MSLVSITLNNRQFHLACEKGAEADLMSLADRLNSEILRMKELSPSASFELLLIMVALTMLDEKKNKVHENGGKILEDARKEFSSTLSDINRELRAVLERT